MGPNLLSRSRGRSATPARVVSFRVAPDGSAPLRSTAELEDRLRRRLRLIAVILAAATSLLAASAIVIRWKQLRVDAWTFWTEPPLPGPLLLVSSIAIALIWSLRPDRRHSLRTLRAIEWLGVGLTAVFVAMNQTRALGTLLPVFLGKPMEIGVAQGTPWGLIIIAYGVLVPSSIRHSALRTTIVALCAFIPDVVATSLVTGPITGLASYLLLKAFIIAVMSALAMYGAYRIEELRRDVEGARELGQYLLRRLLGEGGMASVYLAEHRMLRRPCAVKLIRADQRYDEVTLARFEREVQCTAALTHPNTIQVYDYGRAEDGTFYFAMEFLPGETLAELVERSGPLDPARVVHILGQLCGALHEAHAQGLVHRDIKPGNVMLCERGGVADVAKLLDFGLVAPLVNEQADGRLTESGMLMGTPAYMSPEQCMGEAGVTAASDIYGLGALGYYLLTGAPPFAGRSTMQTIVAHIREIPRPVVDVRADVTRELSDVIGRCLAKQPHERFADALELRAALTQSVGSHLVQDSSS
jgi:tRNA A-37 threonylcarbamoyl transferase component Bud32